MSMPTVLPVLADETRWRILTELGSADLSASALADRLPVSRQAIAKPKKRPRPLSSSFM